MELEYDHYHGRRGGLFDNITVAGDPGIMGDSTLFSGTNSSVVAGFLAGAMCLAFLICMCFLFKKKVCE